MVNKSKQNEVFVADFWYFYYYILFKRRCVINVIYWKIWKIIGMTKNIYLYCLALNDPLSDIGKRRILSSYAQKQTSLRQLTDLEIVRWGLFQYASTVIKAVFMNYELMNDVKLQTKNPPPLKYVNFTLKFLTSLLRMMSSALCGMMDSLDIKFTYTFHKQKY